jgi:hypothetical protein
MQPVSWDPFTKEAGEKVIKSTSKQVVLEQRLWPNKSLEVTKETHRDADMFANGVDEKWSEVVYDQIFNEVKYFPLKGWDLGLE